MIPLKKLRQPYTPSKRHKPPPLPPELLLANARDLYRALGVAPQSLWGWGLHPLVHGLARRFSARLLAFDADIAARGLQAATRGLLEHYTASPLPVCTGQAYLPRTGPLLVTANHPGLTDALALLASMPRADVTIIAAERPLLAALPHLRPHLGIVNERHRSAALRSTIRHLQAGRCVLLFPAGRIEPDPARDAAGAVASLEHWSRSAVLFAQAVPELQVHTAVVRNVIHPQVHRHPLARINPQDRAWLEASLHVLLPRYHNVPVQVAYAAVHDSRNLTAITRALMPESG
jgi:hypothetical protein